MFSVRRDGQPRARRARPGPVIAVWTPQAVNSSRTGQERERQSSSVARPAKRWSSVRLRRCLSVLSAGRMYFSCSGCRVTLRCWRDDRIVFPDASGSKIALVM